MYDCINPSKFFTYIPVVNQTPKFVIKKKQTELDKPLKIISLYCSFLISKPNATAMVKEV